MSAISKCKDIDWPCITDRLHVSIENFAQTVEWGTKTSKKWRNYPAQGCILSVLHLTSQFSESNQWKALNRLVLSSGNATCLLIFLILNGANVNSHKIRKNTSGVLTRYFNECITKRVFSTVMVWARLQSFMISFCKYLLETKNQIVLNLVFSSQISSPTLHNAFLYAWFIRAPKQSKKLEIFIRMTFWKYIIFHGDIHSGNAASSFEKKFKNREKPL